MARWAACNAVSFYRLALAFGELLLLGGRAGDLLGRRVLVAGLVLFSAALLAGGFATSQGLAAIGAGGPGHRWGAR